MVESGGTGPEPKRPLNELMIQHEAEIKRLDEHIYKILEEDQPSPRVQSLVWKLFNEIKNMHGALSP